MIIQCSLGSCHSRTVITIADLGPIDGDIVPCSIAAVRIFHRIRLGLRICVTGPPEHIVPGVVVH